MPNESSTWTVPVGQVAAAVASPLAPRGRLEGTEELDVIVETAVELLLRIHAALGDLDRTVLGGLPLLRGLRRGDVLEVLAVEHHDRALGRLLAHRGRLPFDPLGGELHAA